MYFKFFRVNVGKYCSLGHRKIYRYIGSRKNSPSFLSLLQFIVEHRSCLVCDKVCFLLKFQVLVNTKGILGSLEVCVFWKGHMHQITFYLPPFPPFQGPAESWRGSTTEERGWGKGSSAGKTTGGEEAAEAGEQTPYLFPPSLAGRGKKSHYPLTCSQQPE